MPARIEITSNGPQPFNKVVTIYFDATQAVEVVRRGTGRYFKHPKFCSYTGSL